MYKISWGRKNDKHYRTFIIVPDVYALFDAWFVITGYGRNDGVSPIDIVVTNLDGDMVDMSRGLPEAAGKGTYAHRC